MIIKKNNNKKNIQMSSNPCNQQISIFTATFFLRVSTAEFKIYNIYSVLSVLSKILEFSRTYLDKSDNFKYPSINLFKYNCYLRSIAKLIDFFFY